MNESKNINKVKLTALVLSIVIIIGALGTWMVGTLAAPTPVKFDENPYTDAGTLFVLDAQTPENNKVERTVFANSAKSTDNSVATVSFSNNKAVITFLSPGRMSVAYGSSGSVNIGLAYQVKDPAYITEYTLLNGNSGKISAKNGTLQIAIATVPVAPKDAITWTSLNANIAEVDENGLITAVADKGTAIIIGEVIDQWGVTRTIPFSVTVGRSVDVIGPDSEGKYYLPTDKEHIYVVVTEEGKVKIPVEYVWDITDDPANSTDKKPCAPGGLEDGKYYFEDSEYPNIWHEFDLGTGEKTGDTIWGGFDGKPGGGDDLDVLFDSESREWWAHIEQNVHRRVSKTTGQLHGELTGGGPEENPILTPATPIVYFNGKYYVGPMTDKDVDYYYGDKLIGGNGRVMSRAYENHHFTDEVFYLVNGIMVTSKPGTEVEAPEVGSTFFMGSKDGNQLEWQVLEVNEAENKMLVITTTVAAECILNETIPYSPVPGWGGSTMRNYLQNTFINYLSEDDRARIIETDVETARAWNDSSKVISKDKLFILSKAEVIKYWPVNSQRVPKHTVQGVFSSNAAAHTSWGYNRFWLRDPSLDANHAVYVGHDGVFLEALATYGKGALSHDRNQGGVRPAMWITIN